MEDSTASTSPGDVRERVDAGSQSVLHGVEAEAPNEKAASVMAEAGQGLGTEGSFCGRAELSAIEENAGVSEEVGLKKETGEGSSGSSELQQLRARVAALESENASLRGQLAKGEAHTVPIAGNNEPMDVPLNRFEKAEFIDEFSAQILKKCAARLDEVEEALQASRAELSLASFTIDSAQGRKLLQRCKQLTDENAQLGDALIATRVATLDTTLGFLTDREVFLTNHIKYVHKQSHTMMHTHIDSQAHTNVHIYNASHPHSHNHTHTHSHAFSHV